MAIRDPIVTRIRKAPKSRRSFTRGNTSRLRFSISTSFSLPVIAARGFVAASTNVFRYPKDIQYSTNFDLLSCDSFWLVKVLSVVFRVVGCREYCLEILASELLDDTRGTDDSFAAWKRKLIADKGPDMDDACEVGLAAWELRGCGIGPTQRPLQSSRGLLILSLSRSGY